MSETTRGDRLDRAVEAGLKEVMEQEPSAAKAAEELLAFLKGDGSEDDRAMRFGCLGVAVTVYARVDPTFLGLIFRASGVPVLAIPVGGGIPTPESSGH